MLDPKYLRDHLEEVAARLSLRGYTLDVEKIKQLESQRKTLQAEVQTLQNCRNTLAKQIGLEKSKGNDTSDLCKVSEQNNHALLEKERDFLILKEKLEAFYLTIPNLPHPTTPIGKDEKDNLLIRNWGEKRIFDFEPKDHVVLGEQLGQMDFAAAAKISGARFVVLKDKLAHLQRALAQFMLDIQTQEHGYTEVYVPYLVNESCFYGTGQLPKFRSEQFFLESDTPMGLIPTAEVPLTNLVRDSLLEASELPLKYVAHTPCFRSEAGSYGQDTRGMIRNHQFEKVELVQIIQPDQAEQALEELTQHAETILQRLKLPYRVMALCTGDIGFHAAKTYDLEVWLPSQQKYREISSCSYFEAFQARRLKARWRDSKTQKTEWVHTVNGSGLAVGRTLIAILENYQDSHGGISIPACLKPYLGGLDKIT